MAFLRIRALTNRLVPILEEVATTVVAIVVVARVVAVEPLHARSQIRLWRLNEQVNVVVHEAIRQHTPAAPLDHLAKQVQVSLPVRVVTKDQPAVNAARNYVIDAARDLLSRRPWHVV